MRKYKLERLRAKLMPEWEESEKYLKRAASYKRPLGFEERLAFESQNGRAGRPKPERCEVCDQAGRICFDHCHATEKFRGWICLQCNLALGLAKDNPSTLRALADYLDRFMAQRARPVDREKPQPIEPFRPVKLKQGKAKRGAPQSLNMVRWN